MGAIYRRKWDTARADDAFLCLTPFFKYLGNGSGGNAMRQRDYDTFLWLTTSNNLAIPLLHSQSAYELSPEQGLDQFF